MSDQVISGNFTFTETSIEGVKIVDVKVYGDDRGYFMRRISARFYCRWD